MKRFATFISILLLAGATGCDSAGGFDSDALEEARAQWASNGPDSYRYKYERGGLLSSLSATVYVRQDTVWKFENVRDVRNEPINVEERGITRRSFRTVEEIFEDIEEYPEEYLRDDRKRPEVEYDNELGYPTRVVYPGDPDVADSGGSLELSGLAATD